MSFYVFYMHIEYVFIYIYTRNIKKIKLPLGCFSWAVRGTCEGSPWARWPVVLPLSLCRPTVPAWRAAAVTWTPPVPCVAPAAPPLWRSSTMPLCWSASPSWTPASILSCHSRMVSAAPTAPAGPWVLTGDTCRGPGLPGEVQICLGTTRLVHLQVFLGLEHWLEQEGLRKCYTWALPCFGISTWSLTHSGEAKQCLGVLPGTWVFGVLNHLRNIYFHEFFHLYKMICGLVCHRKSFWPCEEL